MGHFDALMKIKLTQSFLNPSSANFAPPRFQPWFVAGLVYSYKPKSMIMVLLRQWLLAVVAQACSPSTQEVEAGGSCLKSVWAT
jgi:hypothetical protein